MTDFFSSVSSPIKSGISLDAIRNKLLWKKRSLNLTEYDPVYKVIYLGNVLTPWAKGDGCCDKPLATLWKNYCSNVKHEIFMKLTVCNSGLKAITREHGLTEYWSNRITFCCSHPKYPRVFCWIYRHEGRKLKQELRCHAVLCSKESKAQEAASQLSSRLVNALSEFRREKRMRQNTRLLQSKSIQCHPCLPQQTENLINCPSSASSSSSSTTSSISSSSSTTSSSSSKSGSDHSSNGSASVSSCNNNNYQKRISSNNQIPAKKKYLVKGQANFRPPLERSKSAPRLTSIDELQEDEELPDHDDDDDDDDVVDEDADDPGVSEDSDSLKILLLNRILLLHLDDDEHSEQRGISTSKAGYINT
jgi:hypothetical protein